MLGTGILTLALDVNVLVYAGNIDAPFHEVEIATLDDLRQRDEIAYLFWPVAAGFVRIVTNSRLHPHPLSLADALHDVQELMNQPRLLRCVRWRFPALLGGRACCFVVGRATAHAPGSFPDSCVAGEGR